MPFRAFSHFDHVHRHDREKQNLPHWRQWQTTYFVTSRLADSVPIDLRQKWRLRRDTWLKARGLNSVNEIERLSEDERRAYQREFTDGFHRLLDAGYGACTLQRPECAECLCARLLAGHGTSYHLDAWVIMPNHLHALVEPMQGTILGEILRHWKGGSAHDINQMLKRRGALWQAEPFDHIVRSEAQLNYYRQYIARNPDRAHLRGGFVLGVGSARNLTAAELMTQLGLPRE
jgi:REP element-mobilizing transposase RayT